MIRICSLLFRHFCWTNEDKIRSQIGIWMRGWYISTPLRVQSSHWPLIGPAFFCWTYLLPSPWVAGLWYLTLCGLLILSTFHVYTTEFSVIGWYVWWQPSWSSNSPSCWQKTSLSNESAYWTPSERIAVTDQGTSYVGHIKLQPRIDFRHHFASPTMSLSQNKLSIFVTGGTGVYCSPVSVVYWGTQRWHHAGYIGGAVLSRLIQHPDAKSFEISVLVRTADKAEKLETLGVRPVIGSYSDLKVLTEEAAKADFVIAVVGISSLCGSMTFIELFHDRLIRMRCLRLRLSWLAWNSDMRKRGLFQSWYTL